MGFKARDSGDSGNANLQEPGLTAEQLRTEIQRNGEQTVYHWHGVPFDESEFAEQVSWIGPGRIRPQPKRHLARGIDRHLTQLELPLIG